MGEVKKQIFIMKDGYESTRENCETEIEAIIRGAVLKKTPWRVTTTYDRFGVPCNQHERYSFFRNAWEAR